MQRMPSSIVNTKVQMPKEHGQFVAPTWSVLIFLIFSLFVLKGFIYIKDKKRQTGY